jgi:hypothetical protein
MSATWYWTENLFSVHSYPHVKFITKDIPLRLNTVSELVVKGSWSATAVPDVVGGTKTLAQANAKFNVAIDMFLSEDSKRAMNETLAAYEIMMWIGYVGSPRPLGYSGGVRMTQSICGHTL